LRLPKVNEDYVATCFVICLPVIAGINDLIQDTTTSVTVMIAVAAFYVAYQQYKTNKNKLKLDLYDRRYKVYQSVVKFITGAVQDRNVTNVEITTLQRNTRDSIFLFRAEVIEYINELVQRGSQLQADPQNEQKEWFCKQLSLVNEKFNPYLSFQEIM